MREAEINKNLNIRRAIYLLNKKIDSPEYLISLWRLVGSYYGPVPDEERCQPWYKGLESYL